MDPLPPLRPLPLDSHKGTFGKVLIAAGSRNMPGAAVLAARAAYRAGAGLVTVLTDGDVIPVIASGVTEAVYTDWTALGETLATGESPGHDAVLVGPGLGTRGRGRLVFDLIRHAGVPVAVDADALNLLAAQPEVRLPPREDRIWTPHPGEFRRWTGTFPRGDEERCASSRRFVEKHGGVLVLKGHRTVVTDRGRQAIHPTGNPGMATAGSGDVLAGAIVALLGQGYDPFDAACLGVHFHGVSGDLAAERLGMISVTAGDLVEYLPEAIRAHPVAATGESSVAPHPGRWEAGESKQPGRKHGV